MRHKRNCSRWALLSAMLTATLASTANAQTFSLFELKTTDSERLDTITAEHEIVGREGETYQIYVDQKHSKTFYQQNPDAQLVAKDADADWRPTFNTETTFASGYRDLNAISAFIDSAVTNYPEIATSKDYGASKQGQRLTYLKLGANQAGRDVAAQAKPRIFLDAATHGDELISTEVLLHLADELLTGYGTDARLTAMLDSTDIFISFVVNPDGFSRQQRYDNGVDPNRSYPWPGDPNHTPAASVKALMNLFEENRFAGAMTLHAYGRLLMYPWAYTYAEIPNTDDQKEFAALTDELSESNNYTHGSIASTIYVAKGSSADYYYWKYGTKSLAVELSTSKVPAATRIPSVVNEAKEMVWRFIEHFSPEARID